MRGPSLCLNHRDSSPVPHPQVGIDAVTAALELLASDLPEPERRRTVERLTAIINKAKASS